MYQPFPFGFTWAERLSHENVHERGWRSDGAWQPLRAAGAGEQAEVRLRQSDQVVAILGNTKIAGERELECTGQGCAGDGRDDRFGHGLAQSHGPVEEPPVVGRVVGPLATGSTQAVRDLEQLRDGEMTTEVTRCAAV